MLKTAFKPGSTCGKSHIKLLLFFLKTFLIDDLAVPSKAQKLQSEIGLSWICCISIFEKLNISFQN